MPLWAAPAFSLLRLRVRSNLVSRRRPCRDRTRRLIVNPGLFSDRIRRTPRPPCQDRCDPFSTEQIGAAALFPAGQALQLAKPRETR